MSGADRVQQQLVELRVHEALIVRLHKWMPQKLCLSSRVHGLGALQQEVACSMHVIMPCNAYKSSHLSGQLPHQQQPVLMQNKVAHRVYINAIAQLHLGGVCSSPCVRNEPAMPLCRRYCRRISVAAHFEVACLGKRGCLPNTLPALHNIKQSR